MSSFVHNVPKQATWITTGKLYPSTAGSLKRRELKKTLSKVKEEDLKNVDEKIKMTTKQIEDNLKCCYSELSNLQRQYDAIVSILNEIKKNFETKLRENLKTKNVDREKKREHITDLLKFLEEKHNTMSDYSLIDNIRDLTSLVSNTDSDIEKGDLSLRYRIGGISEGSLESMMGQTFDLDDINVTERDAFQYNDNEDNMFVIVQAINDDICFVQGVSDSKCIEQINIKNNKNEEKININVSDMYITDNGYATATDYKRNSIVRLSPSDSVSTVFSIDPLRPIGICPSTEGGLLVTLRDTESEPFQPDSHSRRLVRHVPLTGDVIREYEYQEDGKTRLFNAPYKVKQNGNTDICVVNRTSVTSSELVILSVSGSLKLVYPARTWKSIFYLMSCVTLTATSLHVIHFTAKFISSVLMEFLKYLLTENEVTQLMSKSLYKSTLRVGNAHGLLKVFQYKS